MKSLIDFFKLHELNTSIKCIQRKMKDGTDQEKRIINDFIREIQEDRKMELYNDFSNDIVSERSVVKSGNIDMLSDESSFVVKSDIKLRVKLGNPINIAFLRKFISKVNRHRRAKGLKQIKLPEDNNEIENCLSIAKVS